MIGWVISSVNVVFCGFFLLLCLFVFILLGKEEDLASFLVAVRKCPRVCNYNQIKIVT